MSTIEDLRGKFNRFRAKVVDGFLGKNDAVRIFCDTMGYKCLFKKTPSTRAHDKRNCLRHRQESKTPGCCRSH
mgnify:CR=1 FL=1